MASAVGVTILGTSARAQLQPDSTLGTESSTVSGSIVNGLPADLINGGATRGSNLFHSFSDFNVSAGQRVYFANPVGVINILSRVTTTGSISQIDGLLGVDGTANLFLLNPNGIIFGKNAALDITGSFIANTADSFTFADGSEFRAIPPANEMLTMSVPRGVQFNAQPQGNITNEGDLTVGNRSTLTLFGKEVISSGDLTAPGGTIQVLGDRVALIQQQVQSAPNPSFDPPTIDVSSNSGDGGNVLIRSNNRGIGSSSSSLPNAGETLVETSVEINANGSSNGGQVTVQADEKTRFLGQVNATGGISGNGGLVEISGEKHLEFRGDVNTSAGQVSSGSLSLRSNEISIINDGLTPSNVDNKTIISNATIAQLLNRNNLTLQATKTITVNDSAAIRTSSKKNFTLNAGDRIEVNANFTQRGGGDLRLITTNEHNGNSVYIKSYIDTESDIEGTSSGNIEIDAAGDILIESGTLDAQSAAFSNGDAGNITITSRFGDVSVTERGRIINDFSKDHSAGDIIINANSGSIFLDSSSVIDNESFSNIQQRSGGVIQLKANQNITVSGGSRIRARAFNEGNSGDILIEAASGKVTVTGNESIVGNQVLSFSTGSGGLIDIVTNNLEVREGGSLSSSTSGAGNGGAIFVRSTELKLIDGGSITASTSGAGNGGNIFLPATIHFIENRSGEQFRGDKNRIEASTTGSMDNAGDAGNIIFGERNSSSTANRHLNLSGNGIISVETTGKGEAGLFADRQSLDEADFRLNFDAITIDGVELTASTSGPQAGGNITLQTSNLNFANDGRISASTSGTGRGGIIDISSSSPTENDLTISGKGAISVATSRNGDAGAIRLRGKNISITQGAAITSVAGEETQQNGNPNGLRPGESGVINIVASDTLTVSEKSIIQAGTVGARNAGAVLVQANTLNLAKGSAITASTSGEGQGGNILLPETINFIDEGNRITASTSGTGAGGNIVFGTLKIDNNNDLSGITGDRLTLSGNGKISVETSNAGAAGQFADIENFLGDRPLLKFPNIVVDGVELTASTSGSQAGGNITLQTSALNFANNGLITASTSGAGKGGDLTVRGNSPLVLRGNGTLSVESLNATSGQAGRLTVENASTLALRDGIKLSATSASPAGGGNIFIAADNHIFASNNILINASSTNREAGNGGNISITLEDGFLIATAGQTNDIIANATGGNGGQINISAIQLYGFTTQDESDVNLLRSNKTNDISASSKFGFNGFITLSTLDLDPSQGLVELPTTVTDRADQIVAGCDIGNAENKNEFVVTGRGGLPPNSGNLSSAAGVTVPWVTATASDDKPVDLVNQEAPPTPASLVEAQGVVMDAAGNLYLATDLGRLSRPNLQAAASDFCQAIY